MLHQVLKDSLGPGYITILTDLYEERKKFCIDSPHHSVESDDQLKLLAMLLDETGLCGDCDKCTTCVLGENED